MGLASVFVQGQFRSVLPMIFMVVCYTLTTPVGVAIGIGVRFQYNDNAYGTIISQGVLDGISAGILIFDGIANIIVPHFNKESYLDSSNAKMAAEYALFCTGAGVMSYIGRYA